MPELINADLLDFKFKKNKYDFIICRGVLHHTLDPGKILNKFAKTSKNDGNIEIMVYNSKSLVRFERKFIQSLLKIFPIDKILSEQKKKNSNWWDKYKNPLWKTYKAMKMQELFQKNDLKIVDISYSDEVFGRIIKKLIPPILNNQFKKILNTCRWHLELQATPITSKNS